MGPEHMTHGAHLRTPEAGEEPPQPPPGGPPA